MANQSIKKVIAGDDRPVDNRFTRRQELKDKRLKTSNKGTVVHKSKEGDVYIKGRPSESFGNKYPDTFVPPRAHRA